RLKPTERQYNPVQSPHERAPGAAPWGRENPGEFGGRQERDRHAEERLLGVGTVVGVRRGRRERDGGCDGRVATVAEEGERNRLVGVRVLEDVEEIGVRREGSPVDRG